MTMHQDPAALKQQLSFQEAALMCRAEATPTPAAPPKAGQLANREAALRRLACPEAAQLPLMSQEAVPGWKACREAAPISAAHLEAAPARMASWAADLGVIEVADLEGAAEMV